jgi:sulfhydrogenase subunit beta (sulfur reductase)
MKVLSAEGLRAWLTTLIARGPLIAPVTDGPVVRYRQVRSADEVLFEFGRLDLPLKEFFFPATETMLHIRLGEDEVQLSEPAWDDDALSRLGELPQQGGEKRDSASEEPVIFGAHPCDVRALEVLDALLLDEPVDTYYARRRERTALIGVACQDLGPECFCTRVGVTPDDPSGMDVMLTPLDEGFAIEALTERGGRLLEGLPLTDVEGEVPRKSWTVGDVPPQAVWVERFEDPYWSRLADRCLSCRLCTYVCPTCRCFDVRDYSEGLEPGAERFERLRCWDSCLAVNYRTIAGGHNPRPTKMHRLRNRFYCKFLYYPADFGPVACVGCGRCITQCPVNIDIAEVLEEMSSAMSGQELGLSSRRRIETEEA